MASRTGNSIRNAMFGVLLQLASILTKFISSGVFAKTLGIDYSGINGLFTEVIAMLSLAEMGVGTAIVYNLYKPLAEHDREKLCQYMTLFKKAYRVIALSIFALGAAMTPFIQVMVKGVAFSDSYLRFVFMLFVVQSASSYLFSYKTALINADQQNYLVSIINLASRVVLMALSIAILLLTNNYVLYLLVQIGVTVATNMAVSFVADKKYPFLKQSAALSKQERQSVFGNIKHIVIGKISGRITTSTDSILISVIANTRLVGIYGYYALITSSLTNIFVRIAEGMVGSFGNLIVTEKDEHCDRVLKRVTFLFFWFASVSAVVAYCVILPFIRLWLGDEFILENGVVFVCMINLFLFIIREPLWKAMDVSGLFAKDKYISILGSATNLIASVVLGYFLEANGKSGMYGIFIGTVLTLVIQIVLKIRLFYQEKLHFPSKSYYLMWLKMTVVFFAELILIHALCGRISVDNAYVNIAAKLIVSGGITLAVNALLFAKTDEMNYTRGLIKKIIKERR